MKNLFNIFSLVLLSATLLIGCSDSGDEVPAPMQIELSSSSLIFEAIEASTSFSISSSEQWQIVANPDWINFSEASGEGSEDGESITISLDDNNSTQLRSASFIVKTPTQKATVKVEQQGVDALYEVKAGSILLPSAGGVDSFEIVSNIEWSIECESEWLEITPTSGNGNSEVVVKAVVAESVNRRTAKVVVNFAEHEPIEVVVRQEGLTRAKEGDFYYSDGTFSTDIIDTKEVIGIIYEVSNDDHLSGIMLSLYNHIPTSWGESDLPIATTDDNGMTNMQVFKDSEQGIEAFPSANYCNEMNRSTPDFGAEKGVWFLPSSYEMYDLQFAVVDNDFFAEPLDAAKGDRIHEANYYWTSSAFEKDYARVAAFSDRYYTNVHLRTVPSDMVRCIRRF